MLTERELLAKKKEIEKAKTELAELKGEEKALLKQLEEDWKCETLQEAKKKIQTLESEIQGDNQQIEDLTEQLEIKLNENKI